MVELNRQKCGLRKRQFQSLRVISFDNGTVIAPTFKGLSSSKILKKMIKFLEERLEAGKIKFIKKDEWESFVNIWFNS
jgi:hypothetical protein